MTMSVVRTATRIATHSFYSYYHSRSHVILLCLWLWVSFSTAQPCSFCRYSTEGNAAEPQSLLLDKPLNHFLLTTIETCGDLYSMLSSESIATGSWQCEMVQSVSTVCGCPLREGACALCGTSSEDGQSPVLLPASSLDQTVPLPAELQGLSLLLGQENTNDMVSCELIQAYAQSKQQGRDGCTDMQQEFQHACGCPGVTGQDETTASASCTFCRKNATTPVPEKDLTSKLYPLLTDPERTAWEEFASRTNTTTLTCGAIEAWYHSLPKGDNVCRAEWDSIVKGLCECPARDDMCQVCRQSMLWPDASVQPALADFWDIDLDLSCADMQLMATQFRSDGGFCLVAEHMQYLCGCDGITVRLYLGATTERQTKWLSWVPRISATFSLVGSTLILYDVLRGKHKRTQFYPQLVAAMSVADFFASLAWFASTWPIPPTEVGEGIYGASGTTATCTAQGFFIQIGFVGMLYNVSLCAYYITVIVYGTRDSQLRRWKYHGPPILIGLALALAGLPHYSTVLVACHIPPPPVADSNKLINFLVLIPIASAMILCVGAMLFIYFHVWKQDRAANRWRLQERASSTNNGDPAPRRQYSWCSVRSMRNVLSRRSTSDTGIGRPRNRLSESVKYQATLYVLAFMLTWPIYFWGIYRYQELYRDYAFWVTLLCLVPLLGFWNAIIYFRLRIAKSWQTVRRNIQHTLSNISTKYPESHGNNRKNSKNTNLPVLSSNVSLERKEQSLPVDEKIEVPNSLDDEDE